MAELFKVNAPVRKPLFEGVQGENEARSIQFDIEPWVTELGDGAVTATAKRSQDSQPYPVTVTKDSNIVTWKPTSTDTAYAGVGSFQLEYTVDSVLAKTCIWSTMVAPSLDPAGDPPDPYDNWLAEMRQIAADALQDAQDADASAQDAEAWAKGTKNGTPVPSTEDQYENNAKYYSEESYKNAEAWAVGQRGGVDVPSTDPAYENNAKYWAEQSLANQYGAYIVKSASGEIASFSDGADDVPMKSLNVQIVPKQSGSGDPSPDNVRPITGWTDADVKQCASLLKPSAVRTETINGITFQSFGDGSYRISGTSTAIAYCTILPIEQFAWPSDSAYSIYLNNSVGTGDASVYFFDGTTQIDYWTCAVENRRIVLPQPSLTGKNCNGIRLYVKAGVTIDMKLAPMVSKAPTTTPVPLGQTVYGGTVNPISGELVIDGAYATLNGTENWSLWDGVFVGVILGIKQASTTSAENVIIADRFKPNGVKYRSECGDGNIIKVVGSNNYVACYSSNYASVDAFKSALASNPMQVVYELATPTTVQLTPTQVATLLGTNNVWSDAGAVEVEYRADPTLAYAELQALILENI